MLMVGHSSIAIEVLLKTLLQRRYFHENTARFDEMGACWVVQSSAELDQALERLVAEPAYRAYGKEHVQHFSREVVDGGVL